MKPNATLPKNTPCFTLSGKHVSFLYAIRIYARIIPEDISVTEFTYKGIQYTVDTHFVLFDRS